MWFIKPGTLVTLSFGSYTSKVRRDHGFGLVISRDTKFVNGPYWVLWSGPNPSRRITDVGAGELEGVA